MVDVRMETSTIVNTANNASKEQNIAVGCALAICGNCLISVSLNVQKYTHNVIASTQSQVHYTRRPLWWFGLLLMGLGEIGNFSAFGFAPASLVAPLGTTTVLANTVIAVTFLKEKLRPSDLFGSTLAIVGAFLLVSFSNKSEQILDAVQITQLIQEVPFIIYASLQVLALLVLIFLLYRYENVYIVQILLICNFFASFTVISAKAVSGMLQISLTGANQLVYPVFWILVAVLVVTAVAQVKFLNQAMMSFDATTVVPTNFVFFTITAILAGVIFYKEFNDMIAINIFMFLFGCLLCFAGVYFITHGRAAVVPQSAIATADKERLIGNTPNPHRVNIFPFGLHGRMSSSEVQPRPECLAGSNIERVPIMSRRHSSSSSDYSPVHITNTAAM